MSCSSDFRQLSEYLENQTGVASVLADLKAQIECEMEEPLLATDDALIQRVIESLPQGAVDQGATFAALQGVELVNDTDESLMYSIATRLGLPREEASVLAGDPTFQDLEEEHRRQAEEKAADRVRRERESADLRRQLAEERDALAKAVAGSYRPVSFEDLSDGQQVCVHLDGEWVSAAVKTLIGDCEPNLGRDLVEVHASRFGYEVFDVEHIFVEAPRVPATERQMAYLRDLGYDGPDLSKSRASAEIDRLKAWRNAVGACHYCGMPAKSFGFFDEPVCEECGG